MTTHVIIKISSDIKWSIERQCCKIHILNKNCMFCSKQTSQTRHEKQAENHQPSEYI